MYEDYNYIKSVLVEDLLMRIPELTEKEALTRGIDYLTKNYNIYTHRNRRKVNISISEEKVIIRTSDYEVRVSTEVAEKIRKTQEGVLLYVIANNLNNGIMREIYSYLYILSDDITTVIEEDKTIRERCVKIIEKRGVIDKIKEEYREELGKKVGEKPERN